MPFEYRSYSSGYAKRFEKMKREVLERSSRRLVIEHVGSTAVKGLEGKGIIDISIGIRKWDEAKPILNILRKIGFRHFHDRENHSIFISTKARCEENDYHVHISRIGTKRYERTLAFRDLLRQNGTIAAEYAAMKKAAFKQSKGKRNAYKKLKHEWFALMEIRLFGK